MTETGTDFTVPELRRLRYFHGQLLGAHDFQREQAYLREKIALPVRYLLGYGVVCGLLVHGEEHHHDQPAGAPPGAEPPAGTAPAGATPAGAPPAAEPTTTGSGGNGGHGNGQHRAKVRLTAGLAIDACGEDVVVRHDCEIDLWQALPPAERSSDGTDVTTVWVGVAYDEEAVEPTRTVFTSGCSDTSDCEFGWTDERHRVVVTSKEPEQDRRCDLCCEPPGGCGDCVHPVLWLARINNVNWSAPVGHEQIDQSVRRPFGRRVPTVITGINWIHGHTYTVDEAAALLGTHQDSGGLRVQFSDDVRTDALRRGVVDIQVIEGGAGRNADTWFMGGQFEGVPDTEFVREFRFRQTTREVLQDDDRVMITVRTAFLLDRCCHPVDGTHVGGKVPLIDPPSDNHPEGPCALPPGGVGPWTSGTGAGGDVFESWFFVKDER